MPLVWELHLNAFNGKASGTEVYTTRKDNFSDVMATIWWEEAQKVVKPIYHDYKWRADLSDGDPDKERDFKVIRDSKAYGILIEFFFFDHQQSIDDFAHKAGYMMWARTVINAMKRIEGNWDADN